MLMWKELPDELLRTKKETSQVFCGTELSVFLPYSPRSPTSTPAPASLCVQAFLMSGGM